MNLAVSVILAIVMVMMGGGATSSAVVNAEPADSSNSVGNGDSIGTKGSESNSGTDGNSGSGDSGIGVSSSNVNDDKTRSQTETKSETQPKTITESDLPLPKCDGTRQDCITRNGDTCKAGEGGEKCECLPDMSDCQNHPSLVKETGTSDKHNHGLTPNKACFFNPDKLPQCKPDAQGNCPSGFSHNVHGNCIPNGSCPAGFHRVTDDETGKCFPNHSHRHHHPLHHTHHHHDTSATPHTPKCKDLSDSSIPCIGLCSSTNVDGTVFTSCFKTHKECDKFRLEHDGTKCVRTVIHD